MQAWPFCQHLHSPKLLYSLVAQPKGDPRKAWAVSKAMDPKLPSLQSTLGPNGIGVDCLRDLGLLDLLEHDPRPTFVLDVTNVEDSAIELELHFCNTALASAGSGALKSTLSGETTARTNTGGAISRSQFRHWAYQLDATSRKSISFCGYKWTRLPIAKRWIVISGTTTAAFVKQETNGDSQSLYLKNSRSRFATFDWTNETPPAKLSPHVLWARSIDWSSTPLGPMRGWSSQLRSNASLIMQDPRPAVGFYGSELIMIYNEPYIELLGDLHPCVGRSAREVLAPIWNDIFEPVIQRNLAGEIVDHVKIEIPLNRYGYVEETYFSTRFIPVVDSEGATIGHYEPVVETVSNDLCVLH